MVVSLLSVAGADSAYVVPSVRQRLRCSQCPTVGHSAYRYTAAAMWFVRAIFSGRCSTPCNHVIEEHVADDKAAGVSRWAICGVEQQVVSDRSPTVGAGPCGMCCSRLLFACSLVGAGVLASWRHSRSKRMCPARPWTSASASALSVGIARFLKSVPPAYVRWASAKRQRVPTACTIRMRPTSIAAALLAARVARATAASFPEIACRMCVRVITARCPRVATERKMAVRPEWTAEGHVLGARPWAMAGTRTCLSR